MTVELADQCQIGIDRRAARRAQQKQGIAAGEFLDAPLALRFPLDGVALDRVGRDRQHGITAVLQCVRGAFPVGLLLAAAVQVDHLSGVAGQPLHIGLRQAQAVAFGFHIVEPALEHACQFEHFLAHPAVEAPRSLPLRPGMTRPAKTMHALAKAENRPTRPDRRCAARRRPKPKPDRLLGV